MLVSTTRCIEAEAGNYMKIRIRNAAAAAVIFGITAAGTLHAGVPVVDANAVGVPEPTTAALVLASSGALMIHRIRLRARRELVRNFL